MRPKLGGFDSAGCEEGCFVFFIFGGVFAGECPIVEVLEWIFEVKG